MAKRKPSNKPNILLVVLDTLRRDRLSLYGHYRETSPALDAFAQNATLYERAISPAQWTVPAHASLFTGLYPGEHGVTQAYSRLSGLHPTLAEILQGAGYHTAAFCNNPLLGVLNHGLQRGFDAFYNYASVVPQRPDMMRSTFQSALYHSLDRRLRPYARRMGNVFAQNDELFRLSLHPLFVPLWTRSIRFKGDTGMSVDDLIAYWNSRWAGGQTEPLFAFVNLMSAHLPYHPPGDALKQVAPGVSKDKHAHAFMRRFNADAVRWESPDDPPLTDEQRQAILDFYDAEIAAQDRHLGRLLAWLKSSGALDDTYVVILADHGEGHGEHDLFGHAFVVHQELVHVPLVIYGPERFARGGRVRETVSTRRLFHTLLDLAGVEPPLDAADPNADVAGLSLAGDGWREHDTAFSEAVSPTTFLHALEHRNPASIERLRLRQTRRAIYEGATKLTAVGDEPEALYDTASDPNETYDQRAINPACAEALARKLAAFAAGERPDENEQDDKHEHAFPAVVEEQLRALGYIE